MVLGLTPSRASPLPHWGTGSIVETGDILYVLIGTFGTGSHCALHMTLTALRTHEQTTITVESVCSGSGLLLSVDVPAILVFFQSITFFGDFGRGETNHPILDGPVFRLGWFAGQCEYFGPIGIET